MDEAKVKEFYVIEMHNSREDMPDYLRICPEKKTTSWVGINTKAGNFAAQKEIAIHKATHFKTEKEAKKEIQNIFGIKFKYRLTRQFKYE